MEYLQVLKTFQQLTPDELYAILRLRSEVFVVEQNCVFLDADGKDQKCHHLMLFLGDELVVYARLVPAGISYPEVSIGRIITAMRVRGTGAGKTLTQAAIKACKKLFGTKPIRIGAQLYAVKFYERSGFVVDGEEYDEDGIPHVEMILK